MDFGKFKRIVIKIGSSTITGESGSIRESWLKSLASDIAEMKQKGTDIVIVTSGSVALGKKYIVKSTKSSAPKKLKLEEKQAAASCGQIELMHHYKALFSPQIVSQVLLTFHDTEKRSSYLNAKSSIEVMLSSGIIPIINENDVVATTELRYGDNDRLSARVAQMLGADLLVIFSDIDGLYTGNPNSDKSAKLVREVKEITKDIEKMAGGSASSVGTGGMITKIEAAKIAVRAGCSCIITSGSKNHALKSLVSKKQPFTHFAAETSPLKARKQWIVSGIKPMGEITIDDGAESALHKGKSLLPAGATAIKGKFESGDLVVINNNKGNEIARGLISYSAEDASKIIRKKSSEIENILGYLDREELVHRDNLVITAK